MTNGELIALLSTGGGGATVVSLLFWRTIQQLRRVTSQASLETGINANLKTGVDLLGQQLKAYQTINQELHEDLLRVTTERDRANARLSVLEAELVMLRQSTQIVRAQQAYLVSLIAFLNDEENKGKLPPLPTFQLPEDTSHDVT